MYNRFSFKWKGKVKKTYENKVLISQLWVL